jgi:hypothetical protein
MPGNKHNYVKLLIEAETKFVKPLQFIFEEL